MNGSDDLIVSKQQHFIYNRSTCQDFIMLNPANCPQSPVSAGKNAG